MMFHFRFLKLWGLSVPVFDVAVVFMLFGMHWVVRVGLTCFFSTRRDHLVASVELVRAGLVH